MGHVENYFKGILDNVSEKLGTNIHSLITGIILAIVLYFIYKFVDNLLEKNKKRIPLDESIKKVLYNVVRGIYIFFSIMLVAGLIGIDTSSLIAAFSVIGIAVSLSIQQLMSNVANAFAIYINKPFKMNDHIMVDEMEGIVEEINFVNTKLKTFDNEVIFIPNNIIGNAVIYNYSLNEVRRIVLEVGITYEVTSKVVKETLLDVLKKDATLVRDRDIIIEIKEFADSAVTYLIKFYVYADDYAATRSRVLEEIKATLDEHHIDIPYPIRVVEMKK